MFIINYHRLNFGQKLSVRVANFLISLLRSKLTLILNFMSFLVAAVVFVIKIGNFFITEVVKSANFSFNDKLSNHNKNLSE